MNKIISNYDPSTHRKDKFDLVVRQSKTELKKLDKEPFFALYTNKYGKSLAPIFLISKILESFAIQLQAYKPATPKVQQKYLNKKIGYYSAATGVMRAEDNSGYIVRLPTFNVNVYDALKHMYAMPEAAFQSYLDDNGNNIRSIDYTLCDRLAEAFSSSPDDTIILAGKSLRAYNEKERLCLDSVTSVIMKRQGTLENRLNNGLSITIDLFISKEECEQLTQLPFVAIRDIDIFPLIFNWVESGFEKGPTSSLALSRIGSSLSSSHTQYAKVDDNNLMLLPTGEIMYMYRTIDNSRRYEDLYTKACTPNSEETTSKLFSLINASKTDGKLPSNLPILVDWTNSVFSYSTGAGSIRSLDLSQARALTASHVRNLFRRKYIDPKSTVANFEHWANILNIDISKYLPEWASSFEQYITKLQYQLPMGSQFTFIDVCSNDPDWQCVYDAICEVARQLEAQLELAYKTYSVVSVLQQLGLFKAICAYGGPNWKATVEADEAGRKACIDQQVTPDWQLPAVALWNKKCGLMPHQNRVLNMLKDCPSHAMIPVAAGGGKTIIGIMDILNMYSSGRNAPYLILCPSNLVSQYVQEVSYFTNARLNAIPITTSVIKREGLDRLQKIFESAPRNTVVISSYDALKYNSYEIAYGTQAVTLYPTVMFLRQFGFQYALCDESHQLKNDSSTRSKAVRMLLTDIPNIRLASGTLAFNRIDDLVGQASIMDPSIFGTQEDFRTTYGLFDKKGHFLGLKPKSEALVNAQLKANLVMAKASREEWAAILPQPITNYHLVDLGVKESELYDTLLNESVDAIMESPRMKRALEEIQRLREDTKHLEQNEERIEQLEEKLTNQMGPYLQRLERLIVNPFAETGMIESTDDINYISEKVKRTIKIVEDHVSAGIPGKVIIFTENNKSAEWIYDGFQKHSDLGSAGLLYKASDKSVLLEKFNKDPNIVWMVGVETSLNTGLNLQAASRIIRAEYPWQPGAIEQGNARILRPLFKSSDNRKNVYFDWVVCDGTIDTLKIARLMSKSVEIAKFEHPHDERYQEVGIGVDAITGERTNEVPSLSVTLNNIMAKARFVDHNDDSVQPGELMPYFNAMKSLDTLTKKAYQEYREKHQDEWDPQTGRMRQLDVATNPNPKDAKLLKFVPYVEGTNLYKADELGLQRLDEYLNNVQRELAEDDSNDSDNSADDISANDIAKELKHETVWTEYGECSITSISSNMKNVTVRVGTSIDKVTLPTSSVFLITKKNIKPAELQANLLNSVGLQAAITPEYIRPAGFKQIERGLKKLIKHDLEQQKKITREEKQKQKEQQRQQLKQDADLSVELNPIIINGVLGLKYAVVKGHELAVNVLQQNGFTEVQEHWRAQINTYDILVAWLTRMEELGLKFKYPYDYSGAWQEIAQALKKHQVKHSDDGKEFRIRTSLMTRIISEGGLQNMLRWNMKPTNNQTVLRVMPVFNNGRVEAMMPSSSIYGLATKITQSRVRGMKWTKSIPAYECYFTTPIEALDLIDKMKNSGLNIVNYDNLVRLLMSKVKRKKFSDAESIKKQNELKNRYTGPRRSVTPRKIGLKPNDEILIEDDLPKQRRRVPRARKVTNRRTGL